MFSVDPMHITERDDKAKQTYLAASKKRREELVFMAVCNDWSMLGLRIDYTMKDFARLKKIRQMPVTTRIDRIKRKMKFLTVLCQMMERNKR